MRRLLAALVLLVSLVALAPPAAGREPPERFDFHATGFYAAWRERHPASEGVYLRIFWYANGYLSSEDGEERFWSGVFRYEYRCERREGRDRCEFASRMGGVVRDITAVQFLVDSDFEAASLAGAYRLRQREHGETVAVKDVEVSVELTGRGEIYRSRETYTNWDGNCPESRYRFTYRYRRAFARVSMTGDLSIEVETKHASMFESDGVVSHRDCD